MSNRTGIPIKALQKTLKECSDVFSAKATVTKILLFLVFAEYSGLGGITQSEVVYKTGIGKVTVSKLMGQLLLDDKLFTETHDPSDRRVRRYLLTEKGEKAYKQIIGDI